MIEKRIFPTTRILIQSAFRTILVQGVQMENIGFVDRFARDKETHDLRAIWGVKVNKIVELGVTHACNIDVRKQLSNPVIFPSTKRCVVVKTRDEISTIRQGLVDFQTRQFTEECESEY